MMPRHAPSLPVLASALAVLVARRARPPRGPCSTLSIEADPAVKTRWPGLLERVQGAFETRDDVDPCARVELTSHYASITVGVQLPDGRSATRSAARPEDVAPTLEALLRVPEHPVPTEGVSPDPAGPSPPAVSPTPLAPSASPPGARDLSVGHPVPVRDRAAPSSRDQPAALRIELSALAGVRGGDGTHGAGLGALSFLDIRGWLVGFEGRADRYEKGASGHSAATELALLSGRRFRFDGVALDVTAGPAAALQGTRTVETQSAVTHTDITQSSSSTVPRVLFVSRLTFGARSTLRAFVAVDGELGPRSLGNELAGAPQLPLWTVGLALGATVGTL
jgi:hypothetical protein